MSLVMDAEYECSLNEEDQKRAVKELNEDTRNRLGAVQKLREWIQSQPHIHYPTETSILLIYLRHAKYSQLRAREVIEKNCQNKAKDKIIFGQQDTMDEDLMAFFKAGLCLLLPKRHPQGQRMAIFRLGVAKDKKWAGKMKLMVKAFLTFFNFLLMDEAVQVCGMQYLVDFSGVGMDHPMVKGISDMKTFGQHLGNSIPMRLRSRNYYNESPLLDAVFAVMNAVTPKKLRERMKFHGQNLESVYKVFPKDCLPDEYLPDDYSGPHAGTTQQLIDDLVERLQQSHVREYLLHVTSPEWGVDLSKKSKDEAANQTFRKLDAF